MPFPDEPTNQMPYLREYLDGLLFDLSRRLTISSLLADFLAYL